MIARTAGKLLLLDPDEIKEMFLAVVRRARQKYDFRVENFVIMGNHFHFIIQPLGESTLSEIMKWILGVFAMKYNRTVKSWGHFWGDRFFSRPIANFWEYIQVFTYIDDNPVRASLVKVAVEWRYGGFWHLRMGIGAILSELPTYVALVFPTHRPMAIDRRQG